jgi:hypothetical protein
MEGFRAAGSHGEPHEEVDSLRDAAEALDALARGAARAHVEYALTVPLERTDGAAHLAMTNLLLQAQARHQEVGTAQPQSAPAPAPAQQALPLITQSMDELRGHENSRTEGNPGRAGRVESWGCREWRPGETD